MTYPVARVDLFPADVSVEGVDTGTSREIRSARVIVTLDEAYVFVDSPTGPVATLHGRLDSFEGRSATGYTATLADETVVKFRRGGGCGCGSRLRGFRPFQIMAQQAIEL